MKNKKKTKKEQDQDAKLNALIFNVLKPIGDDKLLEYLQVSLLEDIYDIDRDIQNELDYVENETDSYRGQKREALKYAKHLEKLKRVHEKMLPHLKEIIKTRKDMKKLRGY